MNLCKLPLAIFDSKVVKVPFWNFSVSLSTVSTIYDEFHRHILSPSTTECYSNKYLHNDFRIKWTTINCFIPSCYFDFFSLESIMKPISTWAKLFSLKKQRDWDLCRCFHMKTTIFCYGLRIYFWCFSLCRCRSSSKISFHECMTKDCLQ